MAKTARAHFALDEPARAPYHWGAHDPSSPTIEEPNFSPPPDIRSSSSRSLPPATRSLFRARCPTFTIGDRLVSHDGESAGHPASI